MWIPTWACESWCGCLYGFYMDSRKGNVNSQMAPVMDPMWLPVRILVVEIDDSSTRLKLRWLKLTTVLHFQNACGWKWWQFYTFRIPAWSWNCRQFYTCRTPGAESDDNFTLFRFRWLKSMTVIHVWNFWSWDRWQLYTFKTPEAEVDDSSPLSVILEVLAPPRGLKKVNIKKHLRKCLFPENVLFLFREIRSRCE